MVFICNYPFLNKFLLFLSAVLKHEFFYAKKVKFSEKTPIDFSYVFQLRKIKIFQKLTILSNSFEI